MIGELHEREPQAPQAIPSEILRPADHIRTISRVTHEPAAPAAMLAGQGDETAAHTLIAAVNFGAVLSRSRSQEAQEVMNDGLRAVASIKERGEQSQKWGVSGDEYRAIGAALVLSGDMQGDTRRKDLRAAVETVYREAT